MSLILIFLVALYFLPTIIAAFREHSQFLPILLLDVFLGWTLVGWVVALVWSVTNQDPKTVYVTHLPPQPTGKRNPYDQV
jgi:hypothetical protein